MEVILMERFNRNGMMIFPDPDRQMYRQPEKVLIVTACTCHNGHSLLSRRVSFQGHPGILFHVSGKTGSGLVALSPVYGQKIRVSLELDLVTDELMVFSCPKCSEPLPVYGPCPCGGELIAFFTGDPGDYSSCLGICNRVGCIHAVVKSGGELVSLASLEPNSP